MHSLLVPEFLPLWNFENYIVPATIKAKPELEKLFVDAHDKNVKMFEEFKSMNIADEDLIYFYLGAQMLTAVFFVTI